MKKMILFMLLYSCLTNAQTDTTLTSPEGINLNTTLSYKLLEPNENLRKVSILFRERKNIDCSNPSLTIGVSLIALLDYQKSNTESKFAYLMRHPTANNQIGKEVSEAVIHSFQVGFTAHINNWLAAHAEVLYNPEQSFGQGTITSLGRNQLQMRKGFITIGNLRRYPIYGAIGKMDTPFGQTGSVSPFSNSTMWHAFGGLGYGALLGFDKWGINASFMAVQGGAQFRALNSTVGDSTNVPSRLNNYTADINYTAEFDQDLRLTLGASYVHGSAYCQSFPITHFAPCESTNPAYALYAKFIAGSHFTLKAGYAKTFEEWPGTHNPTPPLDIFVASKVSSLNLGAKYVFNPKNNTEIAISGEFSNFVAGPQDAPWERQNQIIFGISAHYKKSSKLFIELFTTQGFAPLNFISGSNPFQPFPPGQTHSDRDVKSQGIVVGGQLTI